MKQILLIIFVLLCISIGLQSKEENKTITILHTNDTHSQLESTSTGRGGIVNRAIMIDSIRKADATVFVFDSGDFLQGTPYFNLFKGEAEAQLTNEIDIDTGTLGNHEFDNGTEALFYLINKIKHPIVCTNLIPENPKYNNLIRPYLVIERNGIRIGVIGVLATPTGLISAKNFTNLRYLNPMKEAERVAKMLKKQKSCDLVVCLSHLGYSYASTPEKYSDIRLAKASRSIDIILGGHSHTLLEKAEIVQGKHNHKVIINQVGQRGENLGIIKVTL